MERIEVSTGEESFEADVADTYLSRMKGLSFRSSGKMLFVFPRDTGASIDMMLVSEPLHLYFMDSGKKVIEVQRAEPWNLDPRTWKLYSPDRSYRYLLESFEKLEIAEGELLDFDL